MAERKEITDRRLATVAALIGKAQATPFPAERESLALRAYTQLAAYLNSLEPPSDASQRRRERRQLRDRRGRGARPAEQPPSNDLQSKRAASQYRSAMSRPPARGVFIDAEL